MSKKIKTLIVTLGVLILLGGAYYGSTVWKKKKADAASSKTASPKLGNLESANLAKIDVNGLVLEKKGETWELSSVGGKNPAKGIELDESQLQRLTWSFASIWAERIVDDKPADLSIYGLDKPSSRVTVTDSSGKIVSYILGSINPSKDGYYLMEEGDPKVYTVAAYSAESMGITLDKLRKKTLFPAFEFNELTKLQIENAGTNIDIKAKPESVPPYLASSFSTHIMTYPYKLVRGVDRQALYDLLTPLKDLVIEEFVDDNPSSLSPYGLDKPARFFFETAKVSVDLLVGNRTGNSRYAKLAGSPGIFTVSGLDKIIDVKPFTLVDKFALLVQIDSVDKLTVSGGEKILNAEFQGKGDAAVFSLNGKKAETKSFKTFYQAPVALMIDAEYPHTGAASTANAKDGSISIEYQLNTPPGAKVSITLVPYNRDFYALRQEGTTEFLIARNQVQSIYEKADEVTYEDSIKP